MWTTVCFWIILNRLFSNAFCSFHIEKTELDIYLQILESNGAIRIRGTMRTQLNVDVDTLLQPEMNTGYISCTFQERNNHVNRINFAQSWRRLSFNTWIPSGQYESLCNFSSVIDSINPRARFAVRKNALLFFGTTINHGSIFPTLDNRERSVYCLSVSFQTNLNVEALSNTPPLKKNYILSDLGSVTQIVFENTPSLSIDELGLVLGQFEHFKTSSLGAQGEIDIFSSEGHRRTLNIRHGDSLTISVHYLISQHNKGSNSDPRFPAENINSTKKTWAFNKPGKPQYAAEVAANLIASFIDLIHAFWEIQPKVGSKLDVALLPQPDSASIEPQTYFFFDAPGLIVISETAICPNKSSDRSCEYFMLNQLSRAALSGYMGCLSRLGPQTFSNAAFNMALEATVAKRMLLRLGVMSEGNFIPLEVEEFQLHLNAAVSDCDSKENFSGRGTPKIMDLVKQGKTGKTKEYTKFAAEKSAKFEALLRMLEQQIGTAAFNGAVRTYLFRYADCKLPAGMDQFRECIAELGTGKKRTHRAFFHRASQFFESFVRHSGVPVLHVRRLHDKLRPTDRGREQGEPPPDGTQATLYENQAKVVRARDIKPSSVKSEIIRLEITQRRECRGREYKKYPLLNWTIPLTVKIFSQSTTVPSFRRLVLNVSRTEFVLEDSPDTSVVLIDQSHYGFYRVQYENLSDFLRFEKAPALPQPDIALFFDYMHFIEHTGHGLADLPLLIQSVRFQSRPSQSLMAKIADKLLDGPYLRLLAANDPDVEKRLQCFYRHFPELDAEMHDDPDLVRFRSMIAILGGSSKATKIALSFNKSFKTFCSSEAAVSREGRWSEGKLLAESYITVLSLRSGTDHTCQQLVDSLSSFSAGCWQSGSGENVSQTQDPLETGGVVASFLWGSAFTTNPQCLAELLLLAKAAGPTALRPFISSMARGSAMSHELLWRMLFNHTGPLEGTRGLLELRRETEPWDDTNLSLSEIVLSFVKWHAENSRMTTKMASFVRETQQLFHGSRVHSSSLTTTSVNDDYKKSPLPDNIRLLLERNERLIRLNRNVFITVVDSLYCRSELQDVQCLENYNKTEMVPKGG